MTRPLSLYVHLPWCVRKCPYCDFNSHSAESPPLDRYVDALLADLRNEARRADGRRVDTVFLGGGTPSLFPPAAIGRLLGGIDAQLELASDAEITMEANPGTIECGAPSGYRAAGVNRLSLGAQSFDDLSLRRLGRIHSGDDVRRAMAAARDAGFENVNLDLMHGLPGQTADMALADIAAALELGPAHISWYQLTLEPNTVFHARPPDGLPDEDTLHDIQDKGAARLAGAGFRQYEVSAWAAPGRRCRHNLNYWLFGDYLAVGAGAHGKISGAGGIARYRKPANPLQFMVWAEAGAIDGTAAAVDAADVPFEFMINALRLVDGFCEADFVAGTGLTAGDLADILRGPREKGLIERVDPDVWRPTTLGWRFLNDLQAEFLRDH